MNSSGFDVGREDFTYDLRKKIQSVMSKTADKLGLRKFKQEDFKIEYLDVQLPNLPTVFCDYKIVHLSDVHYGQWLGPDRLHGVVGLVNGCNPDVVAITGDFVSYRLESDEELINQLKRLKARDAVLAVLGNHDHWAGAERVRNTLRKSNIIDISNSIYAVTRRGNELVFAGVDSVMLKKDRLDLVLEMVPPNVTAVLLVHEPDFAVESAATRRFGLQLSGHSHGGQFVIPGLGTPFRVRDFRKYPHGKYEVGGMVEYTNRGLGTNGFWVRINCPAEIAVITLKGNSYHGN